MEDRAIAEILSALNQMEAEDRAEDAQRRGRLKLKMVCEGFVQMRKEMPALEERKLALVRQIAGLECLHLALPTFILPLPPGPF